MPNEEGFLIVGGGWGFGLAPGSAPGRRGPVALVDARRRTVLSGRVGRRTGGWNSRYRAVHPIDFSTLHRPGCYRIMVGGLAASPRFRSRPAGPCSGRWSTTPSTSSRCSATAPASRRGSTAGPPT
jgi:Cellulase N-terminal ig-like domain